MERETSSNGLVWIADHVGFTLTDSVVGVKYAMCVSQLEIGSKTG